MKNHGGKLSGKSTVAGERARRLALATELERIAAAKEQEARDLHDDAQRIRQAAAVIRSGT